MKLRLIDAPNFGDGHPVFAAGDCWFARPAADGGWHFWGDADRRLDDSEIAVEHRGRRPLIVVLPNGHTFVTTQPVRAGTTVREWHRKMAAYVDSGQGSWDDAWEKVPCPPFEPGWAITGDGTSISLSPSIHYDPGGKHEWHGFLTDGVLR